MFYAAAVIAASLILVVIVLFPKSDSSLIQEAARPSFARYAYQVAEGLTGAFAESMLPAVPLLLLMTIWAYPRSSLLLLFCTVGGTSLWYGFVRGFGHHQGLITIAFVMFLWAAWPIDEQLAELRHSPKIVHCAFLSLLLLTFAWHCSWSINVERRDWARPYTGAKEAAECLKSVHARGSFHHPRS